MFASETGGHSSAVPLVSVAITTYNLEKWLPRAIDSALEQRVDFPIEIVIGDDCSTDATLSVARSYRDRHPGIIRLLERTENVGIQRNSYNVWEECRGKYVAWLDGDDYWTDPEKLAIQIQLLESDPSISVCTHYVRWVDENAELKGRSKHPLIRPGRYGLDEILHHCFLSTPAVVFRSGLHQLLPSWYFDFKSLSDWPLWVLAAGRGDIVLIDRIMADVALHPSSSFAAKGPLFAGTMAVEFYERIETILPPRWHRLISAEKGKRYEGMAYWHRKNGEFAASREAAIKAFRSPAILDNVGSKSKALLAAFIREAQWRFLGGRAASAKKT